MLAKIAEFLGVLLAKLLPAFIREWRKPRTTRHYAEDERVKNAVDDSIRDDLLR